MSDKPNDGGPAFGEFQQAGDCPLKTGGMSLRDYFAAKAMPMAIELMAETGEWSPHDVFTRVAETSYRMADAMLAERAK